MITSCPVFSCLLIGSFGRFPWAKVSFPQWVYMVLSQKLASDLLLELAWTNFQEQWTALVPWLGETGGAEISGENIILVQLAGLVVLKDNSSKANPPEISLCLRQKLLP